MDDPTFTYEEFSKALHQLGQKIDEMSEAFYEVGKKMAEAFSSVWTDIQTTVESITTVTISCDKVHRDKLPRPSYKRARSCTYGYIKPFQRNLPYQRRKY